MNAINDIGTSEITDQLKSCEILERLNMSNCELSVKGTSYICSYYTKCIDMFNGWWMIGMIGLSMQTLLKHKVYAWP